MSNKNELAVTQSGYIAANGNLARHLADELGGMSLELDRVKTPAAGGLFEVPGVNPDEPETVKEFKAVVLYHHPANAYFKDKFTGASNPPDCSSGDGTFGVSSDGEAKSCAECPLNKFGSSEDGKGKACKQKRRVYILREGEALPLILTIPTTSLPDFSKYVMRLLSRGQKSCSVVTKFGLRKTQSTGGITYSQLTFAADRTLSPEEQTSVEKFVPQVKALAARSEGTAADNGADEE
jgi:hypothetical protein